MDSERFTAKLNSSTETEVRERLAQGVYSQRHEKLALEWLRQRDDEKAEGRRSSELQLAQEANDIAKAANGHAHYANRLAAWSIFVALAALVLAVYGIAT